MSAEARPPDSTLLRSTSPILAEFARPCGWFEFGVRRDTKEVFQHTCSAPSVMGSVASAVTPQLLQSNTSGAIFILGSCNFARATQPQRQQPRCDRCDKLMSVGSGGTRDLSGTPGYPGYPYPGNWSSESSNCDTQGCKHLYPGIDH
eukprot:554111-Rhodomonas_salina.1